MKIFKEFNLEVSKILKSGGIGVMPSDTVYGLMTPLFIESAVQRMAAIKGRDYKKPIGTVIIESSPQIKNIVDSDILAKAQQFWPGPVSVVLPINSDLSYAYKTKGSLPFRLPIYPELLKVVVQTGPLATTSANLADQKTANTVQEAIGIFGDKVDFYVDGGDLSNRKASKIIRISQSGEVEVIRE